MKQLSLLLLSSACAAARLPAPALAPMAIEPAVPVPLANNHFAQDQTRHISEEHLRAVLAAPVLIEAEARIGVVPVRTDYGPDDAVPLAKVPRVLSDRLASTRSFAQVTEISTDWPQDRGISGLRALAARYRSEYLLLYRHRFVDDAYTNGWGASYATVLAAFFVPSRTLRTSGVLEATLFEVKSGTILFTAYERVYAESDENVWANDRKLRALQERLVDTAADRLGEQVLEKLHEITHPADKALAERS